MVLPGDEEGLSLARLLSGAGASLLRSAEESGEITYRATTQVGETRGAALEFSGRLVPLESLESREAARRAFAGLRGEKP